MNSSVQDMRVNREWVSRPDDQRFLSLQELYDHCKQRKEKMLQSNVSTRHLKVYGTEENELILHSDAPKSIIGKNPDFPVLFSNWSFGQLSALAGAPASYMRKLPSTLAAACLNDGLQKAERGANCLLINNAEHQLRASTSITYGRIWDEQVTRNVMEVTAGGNWQIPGASYAHSNPKRATTLYASDRDVFIFLVDESRPIEIDGEVLYRGFYAWNSEVGSQVFGLAMFLYRVVCDNRIIWGQKHKTELRIRHSQNAPERFRMQGMQVLKEYAESSTKPLVEQIKKAKATKLGDSEDDVKEFLKKQGLTYAKADSIIQTAKAEEGDYRTLWDVTQGITANARAITHTDARVDVERFAGDLLDRA